MRNGQIASLAQLGWASRRRGERSGLRVLLGLLMTAAGALIAPWSAHAETNVIIVLDPGHGGTDAGATSGTLREADITLDLARRIKALLDLDSQDHDRGGLWQVRLTRDGDTTKSSDERVAFANQVNAASAGSPVRLLSLHVHTEANSATAGTLTTSFADAAGNNGTALRDTLHTAVVAAFGRGDRGKTVDITDPLLKLTTMPAVTQVVGLLSNAGDAQRLGSDDGRKAIAEAYVRALQTHFGIAPFIPTATGELAGRVVANATGAPVVATVSLDGAQQMATAADGTFLLTAVMPGQRRVVAQAAGFSSATRTVTVVAGARATAELRLDAGGPPATLTVVVTNSATGTPVPAAAVSAAGATVNTDADGKAVLTVPAGTQTVTVQAAGFATLARDFSIVPGTSTGAIALTRVDDQSSNGSGEASGCAATHEATPVHIAPTVALLLLALWLQRSTKRVSTAPGRRRDRS